MSSKPRVKYGKTPLGNRYSAHRGSSGGKVTEIVSADGKRRSTKLTSTHGSNYKMSEKKGVTPAGRHYRTSRTTVEPPKAYRALEKPDVKKSTQVTGKSVRQIKETADGKTHKVSQRLDGGGRTKIKKGFTTK